MRNIFFSILSAITFCKQTHSINPIELSIEFLKSVKIDESAEKTIAEISTLTLEDLKLNLNNDINKKVFWINIYNAYVIYFLKKDTSLYKDRGAFFSNNRMCVAGLYLSFDDIEHGFIRGSQIKLGLGLIKKPFVSKEEKILRVKKLDYRVHFALNCGAKSCPPVAVLTTEYFDNTLDKLAKNFLTKKTQIKENKIYTTSLFSWFRGDFGGLKGVKKILKDYNIIEENQKEYSLEFDTYYWDIDINNFTE